MTTPPLLTRWAVVHSVSAGRQRRRIPRLILAGVPRGVTRADVLEALEAAGFGAEFCAGGLSWAGYVILPEARWPSSWDAGEPCREMTWSGVSSRQRLDRRVTLALTPALHASLTQAAKASGVTMSAFCEAALSSAVLEAFHDLRVS